MACYGAVGTARLNMIRKLFIFATLSLSLGSAHAQITPTYSGFPGGSLALSLNGPVTYAPTVPFLNLLKQAQINGVGNVSGTTYFAACITRDSNGWPTAMTLINVGSCVYTGGDTGLVNWQMGVLHGATSYDYSTNSVTSVGYPAGNYVALWQGGGTIQVGGGAFDTSTSVQANTCNAGFCRAVINVANPGNVSGGQGVLVTATPITNVALIYSPDATAGTGLNGGGTAPSQVAGTNGTGTHEAAYNAGEVYNTMKVMANGSSGLVGQTLGIPYVEMILQSNAKFLRFMDYNCTTANHSTWATRTTPTTYVWNCGGDTQAVPYEAQVYLCNLTNKDCYFNIPPNYLASPSDITNMATVIKNGSTDGAGRVWEGLKPSLRAYVEYGNELWNTGAQSNNFWFCSNGNLSVPADSTYQALGYAGAPNYAASGSVRAKFTGSLSDNSDGTSTLHVTGAVTGTITPCNFGFGQGSLLAQGAFPITANSYVMQQIATQGGDTSTWQVMNGQTVASQTIWQGDDYSAMIFGAGIVNQILATNYFKNTFGSQTQRVLAAQFTGDVSPWTTATATTYGASSSYWTGVAPLPAGTAAQNSDVIAIAPYFDLDILGTLGASATCDQIIAEMINGPVTWGVGVTATIDNGAGGTGNILTVSACSGGDTTSCIYIGQLITSGPATGARIINQLTSTLGNKYGQTGTYTLDQSFLVSSPTDMLITGGSVTHSISRVLNTYGYTQNTGGGIPMIAYEGGQGLSAGGNSTLNATLMQCQRDPRWVGIMKLYFDMLPYQGMTIATQFVEGNNYGLQSGYWGAFENTIQIGLTPSNSVPPKWAGSIASGNQWKRGAGKGLGR